MMNATTLVAWRYLFSSREKFVPLLAAVSLFCSALGVFSLVVVFSLMHGFQHELSERWIGLNAHITLEHWQAEGPQAEKILEWLHQSSEVASVTRTVTGEVIAQSGNPKEPVVVGAKLKGIAELSPAFLQRVTFNPPLGPDWQKTKNPPPVLVGSELLNVLSEKITLVYPLGDIGPTGDPIPRRETFVVSNFFHSGLYDWDAHVLLVPLKEAENLLGGQAESSLQIQLKDWGEMDLFAKKLRGQISAPITLTTFADQNHRLFAALKLERWGMGFLLALFGIVASFSIAGLLMMFVTSKARDVAMLRTIGLSPAQTRALFFKLGGLLGGFGSLLGVIAGTVVCGLLHRYPIRLPAAYYLEYLPVQINGWEIIGIFCVGCALAALASLYPVMLAARMDPLPMLREE